MAYDVAFPPRVGLGEVEELISREYRSTREANHVRFDLRAITWIGHFPATLLYSWGTLLAAGTSRSVEVLLPHRELLSAQVAKALLRYDVLRRLQEAGVKVPYVVPSVNADGLPLAIIDSPEALAAAISDGQDRIRNVTSFAPTDESIIEEAFSTVLFELGENAFLYGRGARPHYQVSVATSVGSDTAEDSRRGIVSVFPAGTPYVEVVLGDTGPGIERVLGPFVPREYAPVAARKKKLSRAEQTVAFAFEFSSSSNRAARAKRIEELLSREDLHPQLIATGLYCVASLARRVGGQVIVRTPGALLSLDYSIVGTGEMRTRRQLLKPSERERVSRPLQFPGTHYWLRLPLTPRTRSRSPEAQRTLGLEVQKIIAIPSIPWVELESVESEADVVASSITTIDHQINSRSSIRPNIVALLPPLRPLSSRATAVVIAALHQLAETCTIIWPDEMAGAFAIGPKGDQHSAGVLFGSPDSNSFLLGPSAAPNHPRERVSLPRHAARLLVEKYFEAIAETLRSELRSRSVRLTDGAFFLGKYYTNTFYYAAAALSAYRFPELVSSWLIFQILKRKNNLPQVILASSPALTALAEELSIRIEQLANERCAAVTPSRTVTSAWVIGSLLPHQGKRLLVLADIICTGETIESVLSAGAEHGEVIVAALVDARDSSRISRPLFVPALGRPVDVVAIEHESIPPHERPTGSYSAAEAAEHRIYAQILQFNEIQCGKLTDGSAGVPSRHEPGIFGAACRPGA